MTYFKTHLGISYKNLIKNIKRYMYYKKKISEGRLNNVCLLSTNVYLNIFTLIFIKQKREKI